MFDRISPVYDSMNRVMTLGLDRRWRRLAATAVVREGDRVLDACCGTGDLALACAQAGGVVTGLDFSERMIERARTKSSTIHWQQGDALSLPFEDGSFDAATVGFGVRNLDDLAAGLGELRRVLRPGGRVACLEITRPSGILRFFFRLWFDGVVRRGRLEAAGWRQRGVAHGLVTPERALAMNALTAIRSDPNLERYLLRLEEHLAEAIAIHPGVLADVATESFNAGGKRLRPVLTYLCADPERRASDVCVSAGAAVELIHMATLIHDDMLDGADLRRGRPTIWVTHGREVAKAAGDYLFARAFSELAVAGTIEEIQILAEASLALARGEALQRRQAFRADTHVDDYLRRTSLKTGKLFEASCRLGGGERMGQFGLSLGIAFQIADDILDCTGEFDTTGKAPGVDLRDGTPTLPLILAARVDKAVARALAGEDVPDALERVAASDALEESRRVARSYAESSRQALAGREDADSLHALTYAVVDREM